MTVIKKNNKKKSFFRIALYIVILLTIINIPLSIYDMSLRSIVNPMMRSEERIRKYVLRITPIGTDMEDVLRTIDKRNWERINVSYERGFPADVYRSFQPRQENDVIGEKHIMAMIGEDKVFIFFDAHVEAAWCFDENSKLIDVLIRKTTDSV